MTANDHEVQVRRSVLYSLLDVPRMGVTRETPLKSVGLRYRTLKGTRGEAAVCWCERIPFTDRDFTALRNDQLGAVDHFVSEGRLIVFFSLEAKKKWVTSVKRGPRGRRKNVR